MNAHGAEPRRSSRGGACVAHTFAAHVRARPELVWAALTDADKTAAYLYGLAAHSTWIAEAPISFRLGDRAELTGRVLHAASAPNEAVHYVLQSGPHDPPTYLTWLIRPTPGGCTVRLEIDEVDNADSREDAEDVWLPVLAALQHLLDASYGTLPPARPISACLHRSRPRRAERS